MTTSTYLCGHCGEPLGDSHNPHLCMEMQRNIAQSTIREQKAEIASMLAELRKRDGEIERLRNELGVHMQYATHAYARQCMNMRFKTFEGWLSDQITLNPPEKERK